MTSTPMNDDALDEMLLQVRTDDYGDSGDSGNYNDAKLKAAIQAHLQEAVVAEQIKCSKRLISEYKDLLRRNWQVIESANVIPKSFITACLSAEKERLAQLQSKD